MNTFRTSQHIQIIDRNSWIWTMNSAHSSTMPGSPRTALFTPIQGAVVRTLPAGLGRLILAWLKLKKIPDLLPEQRHPRSAMIAIKGYSQTDDYSCGAIAGWTVLSALRRNSDFKAFYDDCAPDPQWGTSTSKLTRALRLHGIRVSDRKDLDYATIKASIQSGSLVILSVDAGPCLHWVTIYGVGWQPHRVFISGYYCTPGFSKLVLGWREFKADWKPHGQGLICTAKA